MKIKSTLILALLLQAAATGIHAQSVQSANPADIASNLTQLQDTAWQNRRAAFYKLLPDALPALRLNGYAVPSATRDLVRADPANPDSAKLGLISLMKRENALMKTGAAYLTEDYSDYYADVIASVGSLGDARAIDTLIDAIETGGFATNGLAAFGAAAFDKTLAVFNTGNAGRRESALMVFDAMLDTEMKAAKPDNVLRMRIGAVLLRGLADPSAQVRMAAIEGAAKLRTPPLLAVVSKLALLDRYQASDHGGDAGVFLVRDAAKAALQPAAQ